MVWVRSLAGVPSAPGWFRHLRPPQRSSGQRYADHDARAAPIRFDDEPAAGEVRPFPHAHEAEPFAAGGDVEAGAVVENVEAEGVVLEIEVDERAPRAAVLDDVVE